MIENITMIVLGILLIPFGISNIKGNISSIHWYNRRKITEDTRPQYGKLMGASTIVIAVGLITTGLLLFLFESEYTHYIALVSIIIGISIMVYAQFKYNKGIF